jgi:hypothetical protein
MRTHSGGRRRHTRGRVAYGRDARTRRRGLLISALVYVVESLLIRHVAQRHLERVLVHINCPMWIGVARM